MSFRRTMAASPRPASPKHRTTSHLPPILKSPTPMNQLSPHSPSDTTPRPGTSTGPTSSITHATQGGLGHLRTPSSPSHHLYDPDFSFFPCPEIDYVRLFHHNSCEPCQKVYSQLKEIFALDGAERRARVEAAVACFETHGAEFGDGKRGLRGVWEVLDGVFREAERSAGKAEFRGCFDGITETAKLSQAGRMALAEAHALVFDRDSVTWTDWKPEVIAKMAEMKQGYGQLEALELRCRLLVGGLNDNLDQVWIHDDGVEGVQENGDRKVAFTCPSATEGLPSSSRADEVVAGQVPETDPSWLAGGPVVLCERRGQLRPGRPRRPRKRKVFEFCFKRRHFKCWCTCFR